MISSSASAYNLNNVLLLFARETDHVRRLSHILEMNGIDHGIRLLTLSTVDFLFLRRRLFIYYVFMLRIIINGSSTAIESERVTIEVALINARK